ncbi:MAG: FAD binding domain-containing protein [Myxococcota bacterium]
MPSFSVHQPATVADAVALRAELPDAMYVAGGTDLLPNLKHELHHPQHLVSLACIDGLRGVARDADGTLRIGACTTLHAVATDGVVGAEVPALSLAAASVAGPQHRRMGTLGGNVMLDTRCLFYNQSSQWRTALGACLKAEGSWCHVIGSTKGCVAAQSSDTVPVLHALDARIAVALPGGATDEVPLRGLWTKDGRFDQNKTLPAGALVTAIVIPPRPPGHRGTYRKVRARAAVDFPQLGVAAVGAFEGGVCTALEVVLGAMLPHPKAVDGLGFAIGTRLEDDVIERVADQAYRQARPQTQLHGEPSWRRHLARVETRRAIEALRAS